MTHQEEIFEAAINLIINEGKDEFSRNEIRDKIGLTYAEWMSGYTAIFQAMREDHPGGAPLIGEKYISVFRRIKYGKYRLSEKGKRLKDEISVK